MIRENLLRLMSACVPMMPWPIKKRRVQPGDPLRGTPWRLRRAASWSPLGEGKTRSYGSHIPLLIDRKRPVPFE